MNINDLKQKVKKKLEENIIIEDLVIEDKSFLHKGHPGNNENMFHIKLTIKSNQLMKESKINRTKKIYKVLDFEIKNYIHSLQILIS